MAKNVIFTVTNAGKLALDSGNVRLSRLVLGIGTDTDVEGKTSLENEIASATVISGGVEPQSEVLRLSAMLLLDAPADIHEVGIKTATGVLFAVALSGSQPFFTLGNNSMAASFGLSLDGLASSRVTVQSDSAQSQALAIMESHLAKTDAHPQYLGRPHIEDANAHEQYVDKERVQALLRATIPIGYIYNAHNDANPKPLFDELLGIETNWRRLTGVIIVATDPDDRFIQSAQFNLGQRGATTAPIEQQPSFYNLQTSHTWERIKPYDVLYDGKHKYDGNANYQ